jgi:glutathione S-transferase
MSLTLYFHPLSSFCQKVLIAFYENDTPFEPHLVDFADGTSRAELLKLWPIGKFPVLRDDARDRTIPESSIIIEYLAQHYPGTVRLVPADADVARQTRMRDRFYDLYVNQPMQKVVTDRLRPAGQNDPYGVEQARAQLRTAYGMIDEDMATKTWAMGDAFTMADCAAAPAMSYANRVVPFGDTHKNAAAYFRRLMERPSFARAVKEAQPYLALFPKENESRPAPMSISRGLVRRHSKGGMTMRFMMLVVTRERRHNGNPTLPVLRRPL